MTVQSVALRRSWRETLQALQAKPYRFPAMLLALLLACIASMWQTWAGILVTWLAFLIGGGHQEFVRRKGIHGLAAGIMVVLLPGTTMAFLPRIKATGAPFVPGTVQRQLLGLIAPGLSPGGRSHGLLMLYEIDRRLEALLQATTATRAEARDILAALTPTQQQQVADGCVAEWLRNEGFLDGIPMFVPPESVVVIAYGELGHAESYSAGIRDKVRHLRSALDADSSALGRAWQLHLATILAACEALERPRYGVVDERTTIVTPVEWLGSWALVDPDHQGQELRAWPEIAALRHFLMTLPRRAPLLDWRKRHLEPFLTALVRRLKTESVPVQAAHEQIATMQAATGWGDEERRVFDAFREYVLAQLDPRTSDLRELPGATTPNDALQVDEIFSEAADELQLDHYATEPYGTIYLVDSDRNMRPEPAERHNGVGETVARYAKRLVRWYILNPQSAHDWQMTKAEILDISRAGIREAIRDYWNQLAQRLRHAKDLSPRSPEDCPFTQPYLTQSGNAGVYAADNKQAEFDKCAIAMQKKYRELDTTDLPGWTHNGTPAKYFKTSNNAQTDNQDRHRADLEAAMNVSAELARLWDERGPQARIDQRLTVMAYLMPMLYGKVSPGGAGDIGPPNLPGGEGIKTPWGVREPPASPLDDRRHRTEVLAGTAPAGIEVLKELEKQLGRVEVLRRLNDGSIRVLPADKAAYENHRAAEGRPR